MFYSALLYLVNQSFDMALGWPTHRVPIDSECVAHVPRVRTARHISNASQPASLESWGWHNPACQLRWKGPCWDDARGRRKDTCTLDYSIELGSDTADTADTANTAAASPRCQEPVRLTFLWHSINSRAHLAALQSKLRMLLDDAGRPPDMLVLATSLWDMMVRLPYNLTEAPCRPTQAALNAINDSLSINDTFLSAADTASTLTPPTLASAGREQGPTLRVLLGMVPCPRCRTASCVHWGASAAMEANARLASQCAPRSANDAGFAYLDPSRVIDGAPNWLLSSPCGNFHPFGAQAEALAAAALGALGALKLAPPMRDRTSGGRRWASNWTGRGTVLRCASGHACDISDVLASASV